MVPKPKKGEHGFCLLIVQGFALRGLANDTGY